MDQQRKYLLKVEFLEGQRFDSVVEESYRYEQLFQEWTKMIDFCYRSAGNPVILPDFVRSIGSTRSETLAEGLTAFIETQRHILGQHLHYISQMTRSRIHPIEASSESIKQDANQLKQKIHILTTNSRNLINVTNKIELQDPSKISDYQASRWEANLYNIRNYINLLDRQTKNQQDYPALVSESEQLENKMIQFRKRVMDFKYGYLKTGVKFSRQLRDCLGEFLSIGSISLKKLKQKLNLSAADIRNSNRLSLSRRTSAEIAESHSINAKLYHNMLEKLQKFFKFSNPPDITKLVNQLNEAYPRNELLTNEITSTVQIFSLFLIKKRQICQMISKILHKIEHQNKNARRSLDVIIMLQKKKTETQERTLSQKQNTLDPYLAEDNIEQETSLEQIQNQIASLVDEMLKIYHQIGRQCVKMKEKIMEPHKHARQQSIIQETYILQKVAVKYRQPSNRQSWLWRDWRNFDMAQPVKTNPKQVQKLRSRMSYIENLLQDNENAEGQSGHLIIDQEYRVRLYLFADKMVIRGKKRHSDLNIIIPMDDIKSCILNKKKLSIRLNSRVNLTLSKFRDLNEIKQKIESSSSTAMGTISTKKVPTSQAKKRMQITKQDEQAIQRRAAQMQASRQNQAQFTKHDERYFQNVSIQQFYDYIFSDDGLCPINNDLFFKHVSPLLKNKNFVAEKFDKVGPGFYTNDPSVNFSNCPIFSSKKCQMDHIMPSIPFMPKQCHCIEMHKLYWVSDKQLECYVEVQTKGSSMVESFITATLYLIKAEGNGIRLQMFGKIIFVKQTNFKRVLKSGAEGEFKQIIPILVREIEKCIKLGRVATAIRNSASTDNNPQERDEQLLSSQRIIENKTEQPQKTGIFSLSSDSSMWRLILGIIIGSLIMNIAFFSI